MSPLNRGPLLGPRLPAASIRPLPPPRFGARLPPPPPPPAGMPPRMPPPPMGAVFGPMRQRLPPPPRPGGVARPGGPHPLPGGLPAGPPPLFPPGGRGMSPMPPPMPGLRCTPPRGPLMRPWPRRALIPQMMPHMRPRFAMGNGAVKGKTMNNAKKVIKLEELELKKPWMTDEIRSEIQKKNKLYAKAKKNKDAKEWEEFKDLRNKVTRMIRDAKNEYLTKHPEQAHLYPDEKELYDKIDENSKCSEEDTDYYCEICSEEFSSEEAHSQHVKEHKLCGINGCTFSAHPLVVNKHVKMQHNTGLYERMKNLSTPEDIQKWIEERRRRYPTRANVEAKKAEELEKAQRGEIIKREERDIRTQFIKLPSNERRERKRKVRKRRNVIVQSINHVEETYRGLASFAGILSLEKDDAAKEHIEIEKHENGDIDQVTAVNISDEEDMSIIQDAPENPVVSLVANYESDVDESDGPEEMPIKKVKFSCMNDESEPCSENRTNNAVSSSTNIEKRLNTPAKRSSKNPKKQTLKQSKSTNQTDVVNKKNKFERPQLLQRLLSRDIQHERNLICQCIKYIADNNFFE